VASYASPNITMIKISDEKIYNAYLIETYNYPYVKKTITDFAISQGFDRNLIEAGTHPDITFIESENKLIPIDTIREGIINNAYLSPRLADRKFYILYDAKNIMDASKNAMLKTLEEPPEFVSIFLVTSNADTLPETIKSRCQIIKDTDDLDYKKYLEVEFIDDALNILSNVKYSLPGDKMNFIENTITDDNDFKNLISIYRLALRDALIYKTTLSKKRIILREKEEAIMAIAEALSLEELGALVDKLNVLSEASAYNINKKIATFNFLLMENIWKNV